MVVPWGGKEEHGVTTHSDLLLEREEPPLDLYRCSLFRPLPPESIGPLRDSTVVSVCCVFGFISTADVLRLLVLLRQPRPGQRLLRRAAHKKWYRR